ncbi:MAG TPA: sulfur oxidation c-type cytochrome SoxX [Chromatiaceae bacterium]|nr:sulfur oxidation c-type cytochrome SoxX [Chromatiaceae bacterium]
MPNQMLLFVSCLGRIAVIMSVLLGGSSLACAESYIPWQVENHAIPAALGGLKGDPRRGRQIAIDRSKGNCLACHHLPVPEEEFHGTVGPPLEGVGLRLSAGQIRLRIVDEKQVNPMTIMPGFYRDPRYFDRVLDDYEGKTILTAQEVEDIVAYLLTLREVSE